MSDSDSFIEEVSEEVRRDRLFGLMRRYGWIAILAVLILVGGAAWNEWRKAQTRAEAEALGDAMLAALEAEDPAARAPALDEVAPNGPGSRAVIALLAAAETLETDPEDAVRRLRAIADDEAVSPIYRQIATLKAATIPAGGLSVEARRGMLEGLALGGGITRLLAEEQLAYLDIEAGDADAATERLRAISTDAEATPGLRRRATQVIVALGGEPATVPDTGAAAGSGSDTGAPDAVAE